MTRGIPSIDPAAIAWRIRDPRHLDAHRGDFFIPPEEILESLREEVARLWPARDGGWIHETFLLTDESGLTGIRNVPPDGSSSFWAYRRGRAVLSHLTVGEKQTTRAVCLWGYRDGDTFVVHTMYPGTTAPREIHDPEIDPGDMPEAIEFWRNHAIVVGEGEYRDAPDT